MLRESRKIHLIEEVLRLNDEDTLSELEGVLKRSGKAKRSTRTVYDFLGVLSAKEVKQMKKAINETSEIVNKEDWK